MAACRPTPARWSRPPHRRLSLGEIPWMAGVRAPGRRLPNSRAGRSGHLAPRGSLTRRRDGFHHQPRAAAPMDPAWTARGPAFHSIWPMPPTVSSRWIKRPAWESVFEEMGNSIVRADAGRFPPPDGGPDRWRDPFRPLSRGGRTLPAPLPGGASRRVCARGTFSTACQGRSIPDRSEIQSGGSTPGRSSTTPTRCSAMNSGSVSQPG